MPLSDVSAPALRLEAVRRSFHTGKRVVAALDGITASTARGAVTGLIGPDGAGKTTLMRLIAGLLRADSGRIEVMGIDVARDPLAVQTRLSYMPQHFGLYEDLSMQENLDLYADLQGVPSAERRERYVELLHMTGLGPFTSRMAGRLSAGMKRSWGSLGRSTRVRCSISLSSANGTRKPKRLSWQNCLRRTALRRAEL